MGPYRVLPLGARVDLGAMAMNGYSALPKAPALQEPQQIQDTRWFWGGVLPLCRDAVGVFCSPSQLGHIVTKKGLLLII